MKTLKTLYNSTLGCYFSKKELEFFDNIQKNKPNCDLLYIIKKCRNIDDLSVRRSLRDKIKNLYLSLSWGRVEFCNEKGLILVYDSYTLDVIMQLPLESEYNSTIKECNDYNLSLYKHPLIVNSAEKVIKWRLLMF